MRLTRVLPLLILSLLLAWPPLVYAEAKASFRMTSSEAGGKLQVTVTASNVRDMYAYDLLFAYDSRRWKPIQAKSGAQGFDVFPTPEDGSLRFAYTQIGATPGKNGTVTLATLTFERLAAGASNVLLKQAKLVDSSLASTSYEPQVMLLIQDSNGELNDIGGHWAEQEIREAFKLGIVTGFGDGTFRPGLPVTRAEFAAMLTRALKLPEGDPNDLTFADTARIPVWARPYVQTAVLAGLSNGYEDGTFRAAGKVTRLEMAAMAVRALNRPTENADAWRAFADAERIPEWGLASAGAAAEAGLMQGKPGGRFAPGESATRTETVVVILKLLKLLAPAE